MMSKICALVLLFAVAAGGCKSKVSSEPAVIVFVEDDRSAFVLGALQNGGVKNPEQYKYNERSLSDYIDEQETEVHTELLEKNDSFSFYNNRGEKYSSDVGKVTCLSRGIDVFTEVRAYFSGLPDGLLLGSNSAGNHFPRKCIYGDNRIEVDLEGEQQTDKIIWSFTENTSGDYENSYNYSLEITLNGQSHEINNPEELPLLSPGDLSVFAVDLDCDGKFEIAVYEKLVNIFTEITVYTIKDKGLLKAFGYVLNPGP